MYKGDCFFIAEVWSRSLDNGCRRELPASGAGLGYVLIDILICYLISQQEKSSQQFVQKIWNRQESVQKLSLFFVHQILGMHEALD
jgi:hypothetical protein